MPEAFKSCLVLLHINQHNHKWTYTHWIYLGFMPWNIPWIWHRGNDLELPLWIDFCRMLEFTLRRRRYQRQPDIRWHAIIQLGELEAKLLCRSTSRYMAAHPGRSGKAWSVSGRL